MDRHKEIVLLLEHHAPKSSLCASALGSLGYQHVRYANYSRSGGVTRIDDRVDAVIAVWTDTAIDLNSVIWVVGKATELPGCRGALIVSPFSTKENADLLLHCGARAWLRYPFFLDTFDRRLRYLLDGEQRCRSEPVARDRRHDPVYPVAMPAQTGELSPQ